MESDSNVHDKGAEEVDSKKGKKISKSNMWIGKLKADLDAADPLLSSTLLTQAEEEHELLSRLAYVSEESETKEVASATMVSKTSADDDKHSIKSTMKMFKTEFVTSGSLNLLDETTLDECEMTLCPLDEHDSLDYEEKEA